jgi:2-dehydropantoate 2-reductase
LRLHFCLPGNFRHPDTEGTHMRFIIYGVGAIGGTIAVRLANAGFDVIGIARGAQLEAVRKGGLLLRSPRGEESAFFTCVAGPDEIDWRDDDFVILTMKTQDTSAALEALRSAGVDRQTVACVQNGVANERMALRHFENVLAIMVNLPANFLVPGEVAAFFAPRLGLFDVGRYPAGTTDTAAILRDALDKAGFAAFLHEDVMRTKYGKLLLNLQSGVDVVCGAGAKNGAYVDLVRAEGRTVYAAAGIGVDEMAEGDPRQPGLAVAAKVEGAAPVGTSAAQSLLRGTGSTEIDYLNGEIMLLGRLHAVPTPYNAFFTRFAGELARTGAAPGAVSEEEVERRLRAAGVGV